VRILYAIAGASKQRVSALWAQACMCSSICSRKGRRWALFLAIAVGTIAAAAAAAAGGAAAVDVEVEDERF